MSLLMQQEESRTCSASLVRTRLIPNGECFPDRNRRWPPGQSIALESIKYIGLCVPSPAELSACCRGETRRAKSRVFRMLQQILWPKYPWKSRATCKFEEMYKGRVAGRWNYVAGHSCPTKNTWANRKQHEGLIMARKMHVHRTLERVKTIAGMATSMNDDAFMFSALDRFSYRFSRRRFLARKRDSGGRFYLLRDKTSSGPAKEALRRESTTEIWLPPPPNRRTPNYLSFYWILWQTLPSRMGRILTNSLMGGGK